ncbi:hypothetical protein BY996DRAFT_6465752 [Phakopsora pachyrhizi]|nr:hypothetical protein BY996DRAFT_6465752 [Phakopsora pachyrhizi]
MDSYSTGDSSRIISRVSKLTAVVVQFNQSMDDNSHLIQVEYERMECRKILKISDGLAEKDHEDLD